MTQYTRKAVRRDKRLSIALLLFATSAGSLLVQGWILFLYVHSALNQNWTTMTRTAMS